MTTSSSLFETAKKWIPGGVNSPVRAFAGVGGEPIFFNKAQGAYLYDVSNKAYIDYVLSWGPMVLGHSHPAVLNAVHQQIDRAMSFGAPTDIEIEMARKIGQLMPSIEQVRMVNSGTEATMSAIRLARGYTQRDTIIKFTGCYHGHADSFLINAGSGALTLGTPSSAGVPNAIAQHTICLEYNNSQAIVDCFNQYQDTIAAVIVEPVAGNMNCVPAKSEFLSTLRQQCDQYGTLLIFDEVMTGFRVALGGAQSVYGIKPDLTTLGKVIGGGLPVGAFGGNKKIMSHLAPLGPVYQAGTLSGNPVAMCAGLTTLSLIEADGFFNELERKTELLVTRIVARAKHHGIAMSYNFMGSMFGLFFTDIEPVSRYSEVTHCNQSLFKKFFHYMLQNGVYLAPSSFEAGFISQAHTLEDIERTAELADAFFEQLNA